MLSYVAKVFLRPLFFPSPSLPSPLSSPFFLLLPHPFPPPCSPPLPPLLVASIHSLDILAFSVSAGGVRGSRVKRSLLYSLTSGRQTGSIFTRSLHPPVHTCPFWAEPRILGLFWTPSLRTPVSFLGLL